MATKKALTKSELAGRLKREQVEHPAGGVVYVREMTAKDLRLFQEAVDTEEQDEVLVTLVVRTMVDEEGQRIYEDGDEDRDLARDLSLRFLLDYQNAALRVSGISKDEIEAAAAGDSGNSETNRSGSSS